MPLPYEGGDSYYYTDEYKVIIRSCKEVLLQSAFYTPFQGPGIKFAYRYNFHKFLRQIRTDNSEMTAIPEELIWTISFLNGIENPNQDFSHLDGIYTVTAESIDLMIQTTRTVRQ
jgi:hypothetical protein